MFRFPIRTGIAMFRFVAFVFVVVIVHASMTGGSATSIATEDVISSRGVGRPPNNFIMVTTHLTVPSQAYWETDPDAGPLTLTVVTGTLSVRLGGGLARIERRVNPLTGEHFSPLPPGQPVVLGAGDRLVVVRGFQLTVTNIEQTPATAIVVRLRQAWVSPDAT
jgi:hypothetical protein